MISWRGMEVTSIICHLDWLFIPIKTEYSISQCCPSHRHPRLHLQSPRSIYRRLISLHWMVIYFVHQWNIKIVFATEQYFLFRICVFCRSIFPSTHRPIIVFMGQPMINLRGSDRRVIIRVDSIVYQIIL